MKKATPAARESLDADGADLRVSNPTTFRITSVTRVDYGSKKAEAAVEIDGVGVFNVDLFLPTTREAFIAPKSIRSKYTGAFERTFRLDNDLAAAVLEAVEARLSADDEGVR